MDTRTSHATVDGEHAAAPERPQEPAPPARPHELLARLREVAPVLSAAHRAGVHF